MEKTTAADILGNPYYKAMSYGGYRAGSRRVQPTQSQLIDDLKIMSAMGVKIIRTYNVHLPHAVNVLKAIDTLHRQDPEFEMYVMLGAWVDCKNAWTGFEPIHYEESERNATEIERAMELANKYPHIVKIIAVGNEAMVKWASAYYVEPWIILKWVTHLQEQKKQGNLPENLWITSSDNFASWGGGSKEYHTPELNQLIQAVDYISMHTYPMHDTHYNPVFWGLFPEEKNLTKEKQIEKVIQRAITYAQNQYESVKNYMGNLGINKPIHIGETGWASYSNELYGNNDSRAVDEYKAGKFYQMMRQWSDNNAISCFYFEAFDEPWKDSKNPGGSENHFGLFTVEGKAKYALWKWVDQGSFNGLTRDSNPITKTYNGNIKALLNEVLLPPVKPETEMVK
jgi:exo-beta-1,3-glucanase (GH17 family)